MISRLLEEIAFYFVRELYHVLLFLLHQVCGCENK